MLSTVGISFFSDFSTVFLQSYQHFHQTYPPFSLFFWITSVSFRKARKVFNIFHRLINRSVNKCALWFFYRKGSCLSVKIQTTWLLGFLLQSIGQIDFDLFRFRLIWYFFLNRRLSAALGIRFSCDNAFE